MKEIKVHVTVEIPVSAMNRDQAIQMATKGLEAMTLFKVVDSKVPVQKRTPSQNRALWLWFTAVSEQMNDAGIDMKQFLSKEVDIPWTKESFHDTVWLPLQKAMYGTESTKDLEKQEQIDKIYDTINRAIADRTGLENIPFPNIDHHAL